MQNSFKVLSCAALLMVVSNAAFAEKNGPMGIKLGVAFDQGFGVTAQFDNKINLFLGNDGVAADYLLKTGQFNLKFPVNWYVGLGAVINWGHHYGYIDNNGSYREDNYNSYGVRVPLGVNYSFAKRWDVYGQIAPDLVFKNRSNDDNDVGFGLDIGLGVRYAF